MGRGNAMTMGGAGNCGFHMWRTRAGREMYTNWAMAVECLSSLTRVIKNKSSMHAVLFTRQGPCSRSGGWSLFSCSAKMGRHSICLRNGRPVRSPNSTTDSKALHHKTFVRQKTFVYFCRINFENACIRGRMGRGGTGGESSSVGVSDP